MSKLIYEDLAGNQILTGDFIVYAAIVGRSPILKYGVVTRLEQRVWTYGNKEAVPTLRVITVEKDWNNDWILQKKGGEIALAYLDRMLTVNPFHLPPVAASILQEAYRKWLNETSTKTSKTS